MAAQPTTPDQINPTQLGDRSTIMWMLRRMSHLEENLPRPDCTWRLSDTGLTRSDLRRLRDGELVEKVEHDRRNGSKWRTTERGWGALLHYSDGEIPEYRGPIDSRQADLRSYKM